MTTTTPSFRHSSVAEERPKVDTEHVEHAVPQPRPRLSTRLPTNQLPHIAAEEVARDGCGKDGRLWLVVDSIVYDCSDFVGSHPGGPAFVRGFAGQDCSWQFWNFHSKEVLQKHAHPLRIGKTAGVPNKHPPPDRTIKKREHRGTQQLNIASW